MNVMEKLVELIKEGIRKGLRARGDDRLDYSFEDVADHLISNGVTVQEWISVDDRLPKPFESVIVFRDGKISIDYNEENGWFAYDFNGKRVTHWMPIQQPPKGE